MANFLMPKGHVMHNGRRNEQVDSPTVDEPLENAGRTDVVLERRVAVSRGPVGDIAAGSGGVVMANAGNDSVSVLDPTTLAVVDTIAVHGEPLAVAVSNDRAYVSVSGPSHDAVLVADLHSGAVLASYPVAFGVTALAVSPDGKRVYAGRAAQDRVDVAVIDVTAERVGTIEIGRGPAANIDALRVDPHGKRLYLGVTDEDGSRLIVVDAETSRVTRVLPIGSPIRDIAHAGGAVYVLTSDRLVGGAVQVVDLSTMRVTDKVNLGGAPTQLVMSADQARAYIVDYDRVAVLCTLSLDVIDSLKVDARPSCVAQGAGDGSRLYVADYAGGLSVFSVESSIAMLYSQFLATDPLALNAPRTRQPVTV
ncbi:YVTN family beta-propeller protein [Mycolicibacterium iranicum]|uniref:YVTN family beta-propeller protein n=1 Tax=Mycolicibacterium iranicum TaxID=912594 RepID=A0A839Q6L3_MYCIR|nr:YncE family protein [Mycolicibacterium iranicum]MBB2991133.1 YVTN family beta-propeller protein [Mycolicibacterium iranicum]